jgi:predicted transposase YdaD|tara:strand:- start:1340 stop:1510 length:171 start_codon:yes stop_codon:yes gene_type:complete
MINLKPQRIIEEIKNKKTGEKYMTEEEWKSKGVPEEDIQRDVTVVMPSLDFLSKTK